MPARRSRYFMLMQAWLFLYSTTFPVVYMLLRTSRRRYALQQTVLGDQPDKRTRPARPDAVVAARATDMAYRRGARGAPIKATQCNRLSAIQCNRLGASSHESRSAA